MNTNEILDELEHVRDLIKGYMDIDDDGGPNSAMRAVETLQRMIDTIESAQKEGL